MMSSRIVNLSLPDALRMTPPLSLRASKEADAPSDVGFAKGAKLRA